MRRQSKMVDVPVIPAPTGLTRRVVRGSVVTMLGFGGTQAIRLGGNLILARLLFPEAFGIMALVTVLLVGLAMLSDLGISPAIQGNPRGDDPDFLNTAWTINLIRGGVLFLTGCALAWPMAAIYDAPILLQVVPVACISLLILSLEPTRADTAERHLHLGWITMLELVSQIAALVVMVAVALATGSIWALVAGSLAAALVRVSLAWTVLPGIVNRPRLEPRAVSDLIHFGKWIFLSTVAGFLVQQADKLVLGRYLTMTELGLYNIGFFLASFPLMLGTTLVVRLMIPVYRESPPRDSMDNFARLRRIRASLTLVLLGMMGPLVVMGPWLVDVLYDDRYTESGVVVVMVGLALMPQLITVAYDRAALAQGDSRGFFVVNGVRALVMVLLLVLLVPVLGIVGAALALVSAAALTYPLQVWLARRHGAWDWPHDLVGFGLVAALGVLACVLHADLLTDVIVRSVDPGTGSATLGATTNASHALALFVTGSPANAS
jgi:O-antigen/teichoic acid export membrane protein